LRRARRAIEATTRDTPADATRWTLRGGLALVKLALHHRHGEAVEAARPDEAFVP
jgi:hypothetical protein